MVLGCGLCLVTAEYVACVYFLSYVVEGCVVAVGNDGLGSVFKFFKVVDYLAAEECGAVFQGWFVDYDGCSFGFYSFHHALYTALSEVVRVAFHGESVDADDCLFFFFCVVWGVCVVCPCNAQHLVGNEVFPGAVAFDDCLNKVFGNVGVVGQQLLGIFGQAVASVSETWVIVVLSYTWIEAHAVDYCLGVESFEFGISVEFVEVGDAQCKVGVCEEFDGFGFFESHKKGVYVLFYGALL